MALLVAIVFGAVMIWLRFYTNHGQQLKMRDYKGIQVEEARDDAENRSFELIVKDSIHKVGQPGGIILAQNPNGRSLVKENRKIYVDVTKYKADEYDISELSGMYGSEYNNKAKELAYLNINSKIIRREHDPGEPNHILEVRYNGRLIEGASGRKSGIKIEKGGTLEFVLSKMDGGEVLLPDLVCKQYGQVGFILSMHKLSIGPVEQIGAITDKNKAYIIAQNPPFSEGATINMGKEVEITIQQEKPISCEDF